MKRLIALVILLIVAGGETHAATLFDRVLMYAVPPSPNTAATVNLNQAQGPYQTFAQAGVTDGQGGLCYVIVDNAQWEAGISGTYHATTPPSFTRNPIEGTNGASPIPLDASAQLYLTPIASCLTSYTTASKTSNYSILSGDVGKYFDNTGASGAVNFTLPTPAAGFHVCVTVTVAQTVELVAPASTTISFGTITSAAAGNFTSSAPYSLVCVYVPTGSTTKYIVDRDAGNWTVN